MIEMPPVRCARSAPVNIAYQVTGEGHPVDLVLAPGTVSHLTYQWQRDGVMPPLVERLSRFARLIRFDKRGTGMSDRVTEAATLEERTDDIRAVMDAAGSERAVIFGASEGGSMACMFAAMHPERTRSFIIWGCQAAFIQSDGYPWGVSARCTSAGCGNSSATGRRRTTSGPEVPGSGRMRRRRSSTGCSGSFRRQPHRRRSSPSSG